MIAFTFQVYYYEVKWLLFSSLLYFRYPSQHVYCSEQSSAGPAQSAGDKTHDSQKQEQEPDSTQHKVCASVLHVYKFTNVINWYPYNLFKKSHI